MNLSGNLDPLDYGINRDVGEDDNTTCVPVIRMEYVGFAMLAVLEMVFNLVIIAAAIRGRHILRHNYVYAYVTSTLAANVAFGFGTSLTVLSNYLASGNKRVDFALPEEVAAMKWWAFRKSFTSAVFLIMCASIAAFIYGFRESSYFTMRLASSVTPNDPFPSKKSSLRARKSRAAYLILAVWLFPCLFSLIPIFFDECLRNCQCRPAIYIANVCRTNVSTHCSTTWVPVPKFYLIGLLTVWAILICSVLYLVFSTMSISAKAVTPTNIAGDGTDQQSEINRAADRTDQQVKARFAELFSCSCHRTNYSISFLVYMASSYILFTLPAMTVIFIDIVSLADQLLSFTIASLAFMLTLVYTFVCPILFVKYMPGLRLTILRMFSRARRTSARTKSRPRYN